MHVADTPRHPNILDVFPLGRIETRARLAHPPPLYTGHVNGQLNAELAGSARPASHPWWEPSTRNPGGVPGRTRPSLAIAVSTASSMPCSECGTASRPVDQTLNPSRVPVRTRPSLAVAVSTASSTPCSECGMASRPVFEPWTLVGCRGAPAPPWRSPCRRPAPCRAASAARRADQSIKP